METPAMFRVTSRQSQCPRCGGNVTAVLFGGREFFECDPCAEAEEEERRRRERRERALERWRELTPPDMRRAVDPARVHPAMAAALETDGLSGCALIGPNRAGKTRVAFALLRKAAMAGLGVHVVTHPELRAAASFLHDDDNRVRGKARALISACQNSGVLLIDDLGKGKNTAGADEVLFSILNHRRDHGLVTHWTANGGSLWLKDVFGEDRGKAIVVRLRDLTRNHVFNAREWTGRPR